MLLNAPSAGYQINKNNKRIAFLHICEKLNEKEVKNTLPPP